MEAVGSWAPFQLEQGILVAFAFEVAAWPFLGGDHTGGHPLPGSYRRGVCRPRGQGRVQLVWILAGTDHPVYAVARYRLPRVRKAIRWYLRLADIPGFIRHIAPALEKNLAISHLRAQRRA